jgi:hypothetical protein
MALAFRSLGFGTIGWKRKFGTIWWQVRVGLELIRINLNLIQFEFNST